MKVSYVPISGNLGHVIVNWDTQKKRWFLAWKFIDSLITHKPLYVQSWNLNTMWVFRNALCWLSLGLPSHVAKISQAENGQTVDEFEPIYLGNYQYWWKKLCDFWAHYQPPLFWLCRLLQLENYFSCFWHLFLTFFFSFSSRAMYFKTVKRTVFKVWAIENIRKDLYATEVGGARLGRSPSIGSSKISSF